MQMEPDFKSPVSPGTPLFPLSSERANARKRPAADLQQEDEMAGQLSPSPSLSSLPHLLNGMHGHQRTASDVQGKVAQFNGLAKEAAQRRRDNEAVLKRAILGREEAESESRRLRDANEHLRREIEEGRSRERRVMEKAQVLQVEMDRMNETRGREKSVYEKEVRRARKEAFKSSSELVKTQEELKCARNRYTLMREDAEAHKRAKIEKEQENLHVQEQLSKIEEMLEAYEAASGQKEQERLQYQDRLAGFEEEIESVKKQLEVSEKERSALKMTIDQEEVARMASAGSIALPQLPENDEFASPRKRRREDRESLKENVDPMAVEEESEQDEELMALKEDLRVEKKLRVRAEEEAHFLKMECQFGVCSCRIAEQTNEPYIHDHQFAPQPRQHTPTQQAQPDIDQANPADETTIAVPIDPAIFSSPPAQTAPGTAHPLRFSPNSGTFTKQASPPAPSQPPAHLRGGSGAPSHHHPSTPIHNGTSSIQSPPPPPATTHGGAPYHHQRSTSRPLDASLATKTPRPLPHPPMAPRTVSHPPPHSLTQSRSNFHFQPQSSVTTVPLKEDDPVFSPAPNTPGGMSREEALERIRQRRGRARSFAVGIGGTPGRGAGAGVTSGREGNVQGHGHGEGRVISAPQFGGRR